MEGKKAKLSLEPYKGVRDFYPEDQYIQDYIYAIWKDVVASFGYEHYHASILEPAEIYEAKSGQDMIHEETYTFTDRGERRVTLRPEMTPTVARMIAKRRRELAAPIRWYSIPNLFRYDKPQRGRMREHWQLNVDLFGISHTQADVEVLTIADVLMKSFHLKDYVIRINHRGLIAWYYDVLGISSEQIKTLSILIDKKDKITQEEFDQSLQKLGIDSDRVRALLSANLNEFRNHIANSDHSIGKQAIKDLDNIISSLDIRGIKVLFDPSLMRGFDYYTGMVFEVFDTHPDNRRALFGGGRYDGLTTIFDEDSIPAVGFGMGDVTIRDVLETYNLLPKFLGGPDVWICVLEAEGFDLANALASRLRAQGERCAIDFTLKKIGDQIRNAEKHNAKKISVIGSREIAERVCNIKNISDNTETKVIL